MRAALFWLLLAGCSEGVMVVTVVPDGRVSGADHLHVRIANQGQTGDADLTLPAGDLVEQQFSWTYGDRNGAFTITVEAVAPGGGVVALGSKDGTLQPKKRVDCTVVLPGLGAVGPDLGGADLAGVDLAGNTAATLGLSQLDIFNGQPGGSGELDGTGAQARFADPGPMVSDGNGHLFMMDQSGLRRIDLSTQQVTTVSLADNYRALASDGQGHLYLANGEIDRYDLASGAVTFIAGDKNGFGYKDGTGSAVLFDGVQGLLVDGGTLWAADSGNNLVRKIDLASGAVTSAGDANILKFPHSLALSSGNLFVGDAFGVVEIAGATTTRLAGGAMVGLQDGTSALFDNIMALSVESSDSLLLRDSLNFCLRRLTLSTRSAATLNVPLFHGDTDVPTNGGGLVVEAGKAFTSDGPTLVQVSLSDLTKTPLAGLGAQTNVLHGPGALAADGKGHLYVADQGHFVIRRVDLTNGQVELFAGTGTKGTADGTVTTAQFDGLACLAVDADFLWVCEGHGPSPSVRRVSLAGGTVDTPLHFDNALGQLSGIVSDGTGTLFLAEEGFDFEKGAVHRVTVATGSAAPMGPILQRPGGLAFDGSKLYVSDIEDATVRAIDVTTGDMTLLAGSGQAGTDDGVAGTAQLAFDGTTLAPLAVDGAGHLFVVEHHVNFAADAPRVRVIDLATRRVSTLAGATGQKGALPGPLPGALNAPSGIAFTAQGLFVSDAGEDLLWRIH